MKITCSRIRSVPFYSIYHQLIFYLMNKFYSVIKIPTYRIRVGLKTFYCFPVLFAPLSLVPAALKRIINA